VSANEIANINHAGGVFQLAGAAPNSFQYPGGWGFTGEVIRVSAGFYILPLEEPLMPAELGPPVSGRFGGIPLGNVVVSPNGFTTQCALMGPGSGHEGHVGVVVVDAADAASDTAITFSCTVLRTPQQG